MFCGDAAHVELDIRLISVYTINMTFEWNNEKAKRNALKHGISFKTATFAFDDTSPTSPLRF